MDAMRLTREERVGVAVVAVLGGAILGGALIANVVFGVGTWELFMDPTVVADYSDHVGVVSHLGVLAWTAGAAVALFAGWLARPGPLRRFLLVVGAITLFLGLDDLFRGHENVGAALHGGEGENAVIALYGVAVLAIMLRFRRVVLERSPLALLGLAGAFFALSVAADVALDRPGIDVSGQVVVEDGAKLLGILAWAAYLAITARRALVR
jgi:hypothetical protein